ncbi:hypothetical protein H4S06_004220, partial [Coemansia sp. BCRC 34490]
MRELKISFSLVQERGKRIDQMEALLGSANVSTKPPMELPAAMSPYFDVRLMGIDLLIPPEFAEPAATSNLPPPLSIAPVAIQPHIQPQQPVHIQPMQNNSNPLPTTAIAAASTISAPPQNQQHIQSPATASLLPQKNKAPETGPAGPSATNAVSSAALAMAAGVKKQKTDQDASVHPSSSTSASMPVPAGAAGTAQAGVTEEPPAKPAGRAKGRAKGAGGRKASRASNSPAITAKATPNNGGVFVGASSASSSTNMVTSTPLLHLQQQQQQQHLSPQVAAMAGHANAINSSTGAGQLGPPSQQQQQQQLQQQQQQAQQSATAMASQAQSLTLSNWIQSLRAQGITSNEDVHVLISIASQLQNVQLSEQEKKQVRQQLEVALARAKQNAIAASASSAGGNMAVPQGASPGLTNAGLANRSPMVSAALGQSYPPGATPVMHRPPLPPPPPQQPPQQGGGTSSAGSSIMSPATLPTQPAQQPNQSPAQLQQAMLNQLLNSALSLLRVKLNMELKQMIVVLTPDQFEAQLRDAGRDRPELINNIQIIKATFANYNRQAIQALERQQQQMQQQQQQQQQRQAQLSSPGSAQPQGVGQASGASHAAQGGHIWQGTLHWESRQGENKKYDLICPVAAYPYPGVNITPQSLKINEWPEQLRVTDIISSSEGFTEYCIQLGIPLVRLGVSPVANQERVGYFEDFCNTLRNKPYFALVRTNPQITAPPFHGLFLTFFRNSLVALPFLNFPITANVIHTLTQFGMAAANGGSVGASGLLNPNPLAANTSLAATSNVGASGALNAAALGGSNGNGSGNLGGGAAAQPNPAVSLMMTPQQAAAGLPMSGAMANNSAAMGAAGLLTRNTSGGSMSAGIPSGGSSTSTQQQQQQQQQMIMSPMQTFNARPNMMASPAMSNETLTAPQLQAVLALIKANYSAEVVENIKNLPQPQ